MKFGLIIILTQLHFLNLVWLDSNASVTLVTLFTHSALLDNFKIIPSDILFLICFVDLLFFPTDARLCICPPRLCSVLSVCVSQVF